MFPSLGSTFFIRHVPNLSKELTYIFRTLLRLTFTSNTGTVFLWLSHALYKLIRHRPILRKFNIVFLISSFYVPQPKFIIKNNIKQ